MSGTSALQGRGSKGSRVESTRWRQEASVDVAVERGTINAGDLPEKDCAGTRHHFRTSHLTLGRTLSTRKSTACVNHLTWTHSVPLAIWTQTLQHQQYIQHQAIEILNNVSNVQLLSVSYFRAGLTFQLALETGNALIPSGDLHLLVSNIPSHNSTVFPR